MDNQNLIDEYYRKIPELFGQPKVSFLIGAGCSLCAGLPFMKTLTETVCNNLNPAQQDDEEKKRAYALLASIRDNYKSLDNTSIEDFLSEIQDINAILQRQKQKGIENPEYQYNNEKYKPEHTYILLEEIKKNIKVILGQKVNTIKYHRNFCKAIHSDLCRGRERVKHPVNYFLLNYDTLIEDALAIEGISFNDGFVGGATAWWDPTRFGGEEFYLGGKRKLEARVYKLHGSIDWIKPQHSEFPIRLRTTVPAEEIVGNGEAVVIYPSSMKYKETQYDPYAQMMMSFRKCLNDFDNNVLVILGYGFNDEHINIEISNGIRNSKGALSVIIFCGTKELPKTLQIWVNDRQINSQILILGKNGIWKDGNKVLSNNEDIEWYKFEKISDLLSGVE